ncbi:unnamed protein product, partial [Laminaria digitata]
LTYRHASFPRRKQKWCTARSDTHNEAYLHVSEHLRLFIRVEVFGPPTAEREWHARSGFTEIARHAWGRGSTLTIPYSNVQLMLVWPTPPRADSERKGVMTDLWCYRCCWCWNTCRYSVLTSVPC